MTDAKPIETPPRPRKVLPLRRFKPGSIAYVRVRVDQPGHDFNGEPVAECRVVTRTGQHLDEVVHLFPESQIVSVVDMLRALRGEGSA